MKRLFGWLLVSLFLLLNVSIAESDCRVISEAIKEADYKGDCLNGLAHGSGIATDKKFVGTYKGDFKNGRFNGAGTLVMGMKDGSNSTWKGRWVNGNLTGYGSYESKKHIYKGQWQAGEPHGQGSKTYKEEGKVFTGIFNKDRWSKGRLDFSDGSYIQGQWDATTGKLHGYVIFSFLDGAFFKGHYRNGFRHGKGFYTPKGGKPIAGIWKDGEAVSGPIVKYFASTNAPYKSSTSVGSEPAKCFEIAWLHWDDGGLGLNRGSAIDLCRGVKNAAKVTQCFREAWTHRDDGGLGLNRGAALDLCKSEE